VKGEDYALYKYREKRGQTKLNTHDGNITNEKVIEEKLLLMVEVFITRLYLPIRKINIFRLRLFWTAFPKIKRKDPIFKRNCQTVYFRR